MNTLPNNEKCAKISIAASIKRSPLTKAFSCSDATPSSWSFISPQQFVELISQNTSPEMLPILDCRSQIDFGFERIRSSHNINCRTKIVARKLVSKRLEDVEPNLLSPLTNSDTVILYDQSTNAREEKIQSLPINLVVQAANKSRKMVHIIEGGLDAIKTKYPYLIECPSEVPKDIFDQIPTTPNTIDKENISMTEIIPHVFVGNLCDAQNRDRLNQNGITHIINCTPDLPLYWEDIYEYLRIEVLDLPSQNLRKHFDRVIEFIEKAVQLKEKSVLVHCSAGISRSPTLVLAYMMKKYNWTLDESFEKMRKLRPIVDPNVSFIMQLRDWEKTILLTNTASTDLNDDNSNTLNTRTTSATYCGSTSKSKTDTKKCSDATIIVN